MSGGLPHRGIADPAQRWHRFLAVATHSRSAQELLTATLQRPVTAVPISNHVITPAQPLVPLQLAAGEQPVRILEHLLLDSLPPHPPAGLSSATVVGARLPWCVRKAARRGMETLATLLDEAGDYWTVETRAVEQLHAAESSLHAALAADVPVVRLSRVLYLLGSPVATVVEEIPMPAGRSPPPASQR